MSRKKKKIEVEKPTIPEETEKQVLPPEEAPLPAPEAAEEPAPPPEPPQDPPKRKRILKKDRVEKLERELKAAEEKLKAAEEKMEAAEDRIKRQMAEFDNFRKRTDREKAASFERGEKYVIERLLPLADSFERGLSVLDEETKQEPFPQGMIHVYKQLGRVFEELDVKTIPAEGETFNIDLHNAVMHEENPDLPENTVVQEFQKGYTFKGNVVRHSMVKVVN